MCLFFSPQVVDLTAIANTYNAFLSLFPFNRPPKHSSNLVVTSWVGMNASIRQREGRVILIVVWCGGVAVVEPMPKKGSAHVEYAESHLLSQTAKLRVGIVQTGQQ